MPTLSPKEGEKQALACSASVEGGSCDWKGSGDGGPRAGTLEESGLLEKQQAGLRGSLRVPLATRGHKSEKKAGMQLL